MKIDNSGKPVTATGSPRPGNAKAVSPEARQAGSAANASAPASDNVELTSASLKLSAIEGSLGGQPVIDSARVSEIKQAIADGKFKINPDAIADKLVASVKELLASRKD